VGKSTFVKHALTGKEYLEIDLLKSEVLFKYKKNPNQLRLEVDLLVKKQPKVIVFIDEIQKAPELLDEVHYLIEKYKTKISFIMTGSSARKLKRSSANMLAGRAWEFQLYPFTHIELGNRFNLNNTLLKGSLPPIIEDNVQEAFLTLRAYTNTYLKEEILDEALVRNISAFSRFLELAADQSGKIVNYSTISRDIGVNSKTIQGYYQILEDTLVANKLEPYLKSARKRLIRHPKYYLFDLGCMNSLLGRTIPEAIKSPTVYGLLFEHFIILELYRYLRYSNRHFHMYYWRSSHGAEVDLVLEIGNDLWAIEIKSSSVVKSMNLKGLKSFLQDYPKAKPICVSKADQPYRLGNVTVLPWPDLFSHEWLG
jgi:predicted AAA+ superfamily ATPase